MTIFDIINTITFTKKLKDPETPVENVYVPFIINKGLSLYVDTIFHANDMNMNSHLSKRMQYDYLMNSIVKKKRYSKWPKKATEDENLELVKQYFGYNDQKAKQALRLLNEQQIKEIKQSFIKGGVEK